ncbi:hypothetical protein D3C85_1200840 [compost metagenome]
MFGQWAAGLGAKAGDQVQHAGGQADAISGGGQFQGGQGGQFGRFQHHRGTGGQGRRDLPGRHQQRVVPGDDLSRYANRLVTDAAPEAGIWQGQRLVLAFVQFTGKAGVVTKAADRVADVPLRFGQRFAVVPHFQFGQCRLATFQFIGQHLQPLRTLGARGPAPAVVERASGSPHRVVDVFLGACRHLVKGLAGGRVDDLQVSTQVRADPFAVDVELIMHGETPGRRRDGFAGNGK